MIKFHADVGTMERRRFQPNNICLTLLRYFLLDGVRFSKGFNLKNDIDVFFMMNNHIPCMTSEPRRPALLSLATGTPVELVPGTEKKKINLGPKIHMFFATFKVAIFRVNLAGSLKT